MANAIDLALRKIYFSIPRPILEYVFQKESYNKSLDQCIVEKVIDQMVRPDINSISGKYKEIALSPSWVIQTSVPKEGWNAGIPLIPYAVYKIPSDARENRNISQVISMRSPYAMVSSIGQFAGSVGTPGMGTNAGSIACQILDNMTGASNPIVPNPILQDGNIVKLTPMEMSLITQFPWILRCRLEFDADFTNLTPDSVQSLCEMILSATKAYIYNTTVVDMDMGVTLSGHPIGAFREIILEYRDQYDRYNLLRDDFHGASTYLDTETMRDILIAGIGF